MYRFSGDKKEIPTHLSSESLAIKSQITECFVWETCIAVKLTSLKPLEILSNL